jgi:hypothetical protein
VRQLADLLDAGRPGAATHLVNRWSGQDGVFGHLDARVLGRSVGTAE